VTAISPNVSGRLSDGSAFGAVIPARWNGTLLLDLDFLTAWGTPTYQALFAQGYAAAGTARNYTDPIGGQHIRPWVDRTLEVSERVAAETRSPDRVIAWGVSRGGHVALATAHLHPDRIDGAIANGVYGGAATLMNQDLDLMFALKALLAPDDASLPLVNLSAGPATPAPVGLEPGLSAWRQRLEHAASTAAGRARVALAAALAQLPDWIDATRPRPQEGDEDAVADGWLRNVRTRLEPTGTFAFMRPAFETSAGGNFSWNLGVSYPDLLTGSRRAVVETLYRRAGLDLDTDLRRLEATERIAPDPGAAWFLRDPSVNFDGALRVPVLTMMTIGDPLLPVTGLWALLAAVRRAGCGDMLRMTFTEAVGHCAFGVGESLATVAAMNRRLDAGTWAPEPSPDAMNTLARGFSRDEARFIPYDLEPLGRAFLLGDPFPAAVAGPAIRGRR
jgi:pimeloyl-ACP methyl ester carboxylesterase